MRFNSQMFLSAGLSPTPTPSSSPCSSRSSSLTVAPQTGDVLHSSSEFFDNIENINLLFIHNFFPYFLFAHFMFWPLFSALLATGPTEATHVSSQLVGQVKKLLLLVFFCMRSNADIC